MLIEELPHLSYLEPVAITGASGFIGGHLARALALAGCRPILLGRSQKNGDLLAGVEARLRWVPCDLTDGDSIRRALESEKPDTLFHLARPRRHGTAEDNAVLNFRMTTRLLEAARGDWVRRILIAGSAEEYGNQAGPLTEQLPLKPCTPYGVSKALATQYAVSLHAKEGCPVVVVRPFSAYGPGQPSDMFVAQAVDAAVRCVPFKMSKGDQKRDLIFVDDLVRGLIRAATIPQIEGKAINLGTGLPYRLRDVAARIWKLSGTGAPLVIGALAPPPEELYDTWADTTAARQLLGWEAEVSLDQGLRKTIDCARAWYQRKAHLCHTA